VIDRAEDLDGDAVLAARNRPADGERDGMPSTDSPVAADAVRTDADPSDDVLANAEQRAAAHRLHRDTVDHTYDVARIEAGQEAEPQDSRGSQPRGAGASEEGATRDPGSREAEAEPHGYVAEDAEAQPTEAVGGDPPEAGGRDAPEARSGEAAEAEDGEVPDAEKRAAEVPDAEETGARDAWAEALPGLRAAWEKHERQFPERSGSAAPSSQADGGWLAEGGRRLTPEQNTDASKACEDIRTEGREVILPAMERVEAADPDRRLAGLEHMLKGEDRLKEKIAVALRARPELTVGQALEIVPDPVRFTFTYSSERYAEGVLSDVDRLKSKGFELIKLKNLWAEEQYKGINSQWRRPETGLRFEMQFHTPESLEAKELTHKAYERIRGPASPAERSELENFQRRANEPLDTPPGTAKIRDFPEKR
jgi:hypothetical protein